MEEANTELCLDELAEIGGSFLSNDISEMPVALKVIVGCG